MHSVGDRILSGLKRTFIITLKCLEGGSHRGFLSRSKTLFEEVCLVKGDVSGP